MRHAGWISALLQIWNPSFSIFFFLRRGNHRECINSSACVMSAVFSTNNGSALIIRFYCVRHVSILIIMYGYSSTSKNSIPSFSSQSSFQIYIPGLTFTLSDFASTHPHKFASFHTPNFWGQGQVLSNETYICWSCFDSISSRPLQTSFFLPSCFFGVF